MTLAITVEDGTSKTTSNSYISLADAETYFESRLHITNWTEATTDNKNRALVQAARMIDRYVRYIGWKTEDTQAMEWPRAGIYYDGSKYWSDVSYQIEWEVYSVADNYIPKEIKYAQCELALTLLAGDIQALPDTAGYSSISVAGAVSLVVDKSDRVKMVPDHVMKMISHFGTLSGYSSSVNLARA